MTAMRHSTTDRLSATHGWLRALRLAAVMIGVGLLVSATTARAQDDEDQPDESFEAGIIKNIMHGLGGKSVEDRGINYRERSPLVVPSNVTALPPPETGKPKLAPNWPKDPDEIARKEAIEANRKPLPDAREAARPLTPSELNIKPARKRRTVADTGPDDARDYNNHLLSPSQLGFTNGMFSKMFGGTNVETTPFKGEPDRETLTEPPAGYQTPSPNYAYGSGPMKPLNGVYDPASGKYGDQ
jgi:hypothetical protein